MGVALVTTKEEQGNVVLAIHFTGVLAWDVLIKEDFTIVS